MKSTTGEKYRIAGEFMIEVAIVEDEQVYTDQLTKYLNQYEQESGRQIHATVFPDGAEIAEDYKGGYDIILMDIQMKYMDGMTAAEKIRKIDQTVIIIFITNMTQYAIRGYEVDALDYIVKPVEYFSFSKKLQRAMERIPKKQEEVLTISMDGGIRKLPVSQLLYVESFGHNLGYHMADGYYENRGTMKDMETELARYHFYRIGKSYLVNLSKVEAIVGSDCVIGTEHLSISRQKKKDLMETLSRYMTEMM